MLSELVLIPCAYIISLIIVSIISVFTGWSDMVVQIICIVITVLVAIGAIRQIIDDMGFERGKKKRLEDMEKRVREINGLLNRGGLSQNQVNNLLEEREAIIESLDRRYEKMYAPPKVEKQNSQSDNSRARGCPQYTETFCGISYRYG